MNNMRVLFLADLKITNRELDQLKSEFSSLVHQYADIKPDFYTEREDYSNVPVEADSDGDLKPTKKYFTALTDKVHAKYGTYGVDSVVVLVHRDNWIFKGIWGTNLSLVYRQYHVHLCRFDDRNMANSLGTLYHEWMHSLDSLIKTHTGVEIDNLFNKTKCFYDWDATCCHGNKYRPCKDTLFEYIRYKENADTLTTLAPHLRNAYRIRKEFYLEPYRKVQLRVVSFLRSWLNRKNGVSN